MTYYDDYLEHHGVKGMKWGVRKYKDIRKEAKTHQRDKDRAASKKYKAERAYETAKVKTAGREDKLASVKQRHQIVGSERTAKKVIKATEKHAKAKAKEATAYEKKRIGSKDYNKAQYRYQKAVNKAADLPIYIKRRDGMAEVKRSSKSAGVHLALSAMEAYSGIPMTGVVPNSRYTRNDRFASSVDSAQKRKQRVS